MSSEDGLVRRHRPPWSQSAACPPSHIPRRPDFGTERAGHVLVVPSLHRVQFLCCHMFIGGGVSPWNPEHTASNLILRLGSFPRDEIQRGR